MPCCPVGLTITQVAQSVINVSWTVGTGALTYVTVLESPAGQPKCHTRQNHCLLGCVACGVNYTVALKAISAAGVTADCTYHSYSSSKQVLNSSSAVLARTLTSHHKSSQKPLLPFQKQAVSLPTLRCKFRLPSKMFCFSLDLEPPSFRGFCW